MAVFYLDASAVLKRYRKEKGTHVVDDIFSQRGDRHILLTSQLTCVEVESVAARARKAKILSDYEYATLVAGFARDLRQGLRLVPVGYDTIVEAAQTVREVPLRSLDAIHYTVVKQMKKRWDLPSAPFVFVGSDHDLLEACRSNSIKAIDPEEEDALEVLNYFLNWKGEQ